MPMGNRTGPMTGRAAGYCAGFGSPGFLNRGPGFGFGRGFGRGGGGRGWRHRFHATGLTGWQRGAAGLPAFGASGPWPAQAASSELEQLRQQAGFLQQAVEAIRQRLSQLTAKEAPAQTDKPGDAA